MARLVNKSFLYRNGSELIPIVDSPDFGGIDLRAHDCRRNVRDSK